MSGLDPTRVCLLENGQYMEVALDTKDEQQIQRAIEKITQVFLLRIREANETNRTNTNTGKNKKHTASKNKNR